ncbi:MAG: hypothetical protein ACD_58C00297G0010 [uncultured bacterium]|nr:MAG: hypothetical protein ACD_58C00297G0010 [uncultured bacterium]
MSDLNFTLKFYDGDGTVMVYHVSQKEKNFSLVEVIITGSWGYGPEETWYQSLDDLREKLGESQEWSWLNHFWFDGRSLDEVNGKTVRFHYKSPFSITIEDENGNDTKTVFDHEGLEAQKNEQKQFANMQLQTLKRMGYSEKEASSIIGSAGPGRAVEAAQWAAKNCPMCETEVKWDALMMVLSGALTSGTGYDRLVVAIESLGFSRVPACGSRTGLVKFLKGARAAMFSPTFRRNGGGRPVVIDQVPA